jgi:hypothetical protein
LHYIFINKQKKYNYRIFCNIIRNGSVTNIDREALLLNGGETGPGSGGQGNQWTCRGCKEAGHMCCSTVATPKTEK